MDQDTFEMTADDVVEIVNIFDENHIEVIIDGGWGVDALLGEQTRTHEDLDVAVQHKDVEGIRKIFMDRGYREIPRNDSWECNFVLGDEKGRLLDIHSCTFDADGNHIFGVDYPYESLQGEGSINGVRVKCITPEWMVKFHAGYELDENDYHDVKLLCRKFGIEVPAEYEEFVAKEN